MIVAVVAALAALAAAAERPNFVIYMPDDLQNTFTRPDSPPGVRRFLDAPMPAFERIMAEGVTFSGAYAASPSCAPSRASLLSGRYASRTEGARDATQRGNDDDSTIVDVTSGTTRLKDDDNDKTIAKVLADAGYRTGAAGKWHISPNLSDRNDGASFDDYPATVASVQARGFTHVPAIYANNMDGVEGLGFSHNLEWTTAESQTFISDAVAADEPFLLYYAPTAPHTPSIEEALFDFSVRDTPAGPLEQDPAPGMPTRQSVWDRAADVSSNRQDNAAGSIWVDDALAAIVAHLESLEILDNTMVVILNDHGMGGKNLLFEQGTRILAAARYPALFDADTVVDTPVTNMDIAATILDLADVEAPFPLDGRPLADRTANDVFFFEIDRSRAVVFGDWKMHEYTTGDNTSEDTASIWPAYADPVQLYNLAADSIESVNVAAQNPTERDLLLALLQCHKTATAIDADKDADETACVAGLVGGAGDDDDSGDDDDDSAPGDDDDSAPGDDDDSAPGDDDDSAPGDDDDSAPGDDDDDDDDDSAPADDDDAIGGSPHNLPSALVALAVFFVYV